MRIINFKSSIFEQYPRLYEFMKFSIVGCIALIILYAIYYTLLSSVGHNTAYSIGYVISFVCNYILTLKFTFKTNASKNNGVGFVFSHFVNYIIQVGALNVFIYLGMPKQLAPIPVFAICVPVNFVLVRFFMKK